ncbi:MAG: hypothetical protein A2Y17_05945 [Clostridiales bacterium GWF2_38_85]|nr:MAG: hypothetical protein A2Y17_05945 [Clostridiales bacterium GWF2_38_85]HBL84574.1 hypothetical protein [Clostridiales bacterium]
MKSKKKEITIIIIIAVVVVALTGIYFATKAIIGNDTSETSSAIERKFIYPNIQRADVQDITVTNSYGSYKVYRASDNNFYFEGAEFVGYDSEKFSSLIVNSTYMLSLYKLEGITDYSIYGLDVEKDNPAYVEINTVDNKYHKIFIGDAIPSGGGYYAKYYNEDTVYVLDSSIATSHLCSVYYYLQPYLSIQISSPTDYVNINNFMFSKKLNEDDEALTPVVNIRLKAANEKIENDIFPYLMVYPTNVYTASTDAYSAVQATLAAMSGTSVVDYGIIPASEENTEEYAAYIERLAKWGLDKPMYEVLYSYDDQYYYIKFSKPDEDGNLYAYSMLSTAVVELPISNIPFLEWGLIDFVDVQIFSQNIGTVHKIVASFDDKSYIYNIVLDDEKKVTNVYADGKEYNVDSFKKYYLTFLQFYLVDYQEPPDEGTEPILTVNVECDSGNFEYKFYRSTSRKCFYTINGEGEFYVSYDMVKNMMDQSIAISKDEILSNE